MFAHVPIHASVVALLCGWLGGPALTFINIREGQASNTAAVAEWLQVGWQYKDTLEAAKFLETRLTILFFLQFATSSLSLHKHSLPPTRHLLKTRSVSEQKPKT